jgi:hypothetical protein
MTRDAGERRSERLGDVGDLPLLRGAARSTVDRLRAHTDQLAVGDGTLVLPAGRPVDWVPVALTGQLRTDGAHGRHWPAGALVELGAALTRRPIDRAVVADGPVQLLYLDARALTAAITLEPVLGLAVARSLAGELEPAADVRRPVRRRHLRVVVPA